MSEFIKRAVYWRLVIWKFLSGLLVTGLTFCLGAEAIKHWSITPFYEKFVFTALLTINLLKWVDGFLDQTFARLKSGKPPVQVGSDTNPPFPT